MNKKPKNITEIGFGCKLPVKTVNLLKKECIDQNMKLKDLVNQIFLEYLKK